MSGPPARVAAAVPVTSILNATVPESPVLFPQALPLIVSTAYLGWDAAAAGVGGVAQVSMPSWKMVKVWGSRLALSKLPGDIGTTRTITPLNLRLNGAAWA